MDYKEAYRKLRRAKVDAIANSTNIVVGRSELNCALKALEDLIVDSDEKKIRRALKRNLEKNCN